jgi:ferrous iron transport protein A
MPLTVADTGEEYVIKRIGGKPEVKQHLENLGFVVGGVGHQYDGRQRHCQGEGVPDSHQPGNGAENYGLTRKKGGIGMKTLKQAKVGDTVTVVKLHGEGAVKRRIMDMGITKGVTVYVRKVAPLGDPVEVNVRGYELSIRKADAEMIEIQ